MHRQETSHAKNHCSRCFCVHPRRIAVAAVSDVLKKKAVKLCSTVPLIQIPNLASPYLVKESTTLLRILSFVFPPGPLNTLISLIS